MRDKAQFTEELRELAPGVASESVWDALRAAAPEAMAETAHARRRQEVLDALLAEPLPRPSLLSALWSELALLPVSSVGLAIALTLAMVAVEELVPPLKIRGYALAWIALGAPWLGILWGLTVAPSRQGAWSDWRAIAPLRLELLMAVRLGAVGLVSLLVAATLPLIGLPAGGSMGSLILSWLGPFALGSVLMVLLTWRWGAAIGLSASAGIWGLPIVVGLTSGGRVPTTVAVLFSYALGGGQQSPLVSGGAMLVIAFALGLWVTRRGASWSLN